MGFNKLLNWLMFSLLMDDMDVGHVEPDVVAFWCISLFIHVSTGILNRTRTEEQGL
jgi:hypothetical protein